MVDYGVSVKSGTPEDDVFLKALLNFAVYNCILGVVLVILSYIATVLMNMAAFNQVTNTDIVKC